MKLNHETVELSGKAVRWEGETGRWELVGLRPIGGFADDGDWTP